MTVTLCNGKGGSGKTTLSVLLASALAEAGHETAILDTDPQKTATRWLQESAAADLSLELARNGKQYSAMFIDTPPRLESRAVTESVRRADIVILVSGPSPVDLFTSRDTVAMLDKEGVRKKQGSFSTKCNPGPSCLATSPT